MPTITYLVRKSLPAPILSYARRLKAYCWYLVHPQPSVLLSLEAQFPWSSPNIWKRVESFYLSRPQPVVFEYGTGVSSLWHIRNLIVKGGTYIGVEHKADWYVQVLQGIIQYGVNHRLTVDYAGSPVPMPPDFPVLAYDARLTIKGPQSVGCTVKLKLRPPNNRTQDPDGTLAEFREYVRSLDEPCDVVIIDGRARKACVNYVLDTNYLKLGGLLALFDAGRGQEGWLGSPGLTGTSDYQPEVRRMLALGAELCDGSGLDTWPGLKRRRSMSSTAFAYPAEACFLVRR